MTAGKSRVAHAVTIVVPVYGDLPSVLECVDSIIEHVDLATHRVLLMNDNGPEADAIEAALLARISGQPSIRHHRNEQNLGFVGNCNRAVLEIDRTSNDILLLNSDTLVTPGFLDELSRILHSSDAHGAICPRSNNATVASLPFALRDPSRGRSITRTAAVHAALADDLPPFSYAPVAMGFCILIRRDLIERFGLFDEIYAPGYGEENDFCLRIGRAGYRSLIAHRAVVFHQGARSFQGARREALRSAHEKIVVSRYPEYTKAVQKYIYVDRDPVDVFADALVPADAVSRLLIDLGADGMGSESRAADPDPEQIGRLVAQLGARDGVALTVSVPAKRMRETKRRFSGTRIVAREHLNGVWDAGMGAGVADSHQRAMLNRTCLRILVQSDRTHIPGAMVVALDPDSMVTAARTPSNLEALRARWASITAEPGYLNDAGAPREVLARRLIRRAEQIAPRFVGHAKGAVRRLVGRTPQ
ncbi:glycosyltransferase family 2 protein [Leifsonia sp. NPDC058248]|uniref:glycosyltransferase family 2 protein n=1 Tax=Leifsonia sp. NPDC058248 TaxID=3346402 RepID=UPI0036DAF9AE